MHLVSAYSPAEGPAIRLANGGQHERQLQYGRSKIRHQFWHRACHRHLLHQQPLDTLGIIHGFFSWLYVIYFALLK